MRTSLLAAGLLGALALPAAAQEGGKRKTGFVDRVCRGPGGENRKYVVFVPADYNANPDKRYPVIFFLHGSGEGGDDGRAQTRVGIGPSVEARAKTLPFIVVFPQSKEGWEHGADSADGRRTMAVLDEVLREYRADPLRVAVTGVSMGGAGAWDYATHHPARWSAVVPVCCVAGVPKKADRIADVPCWCFHGAKDKSAPLKASQEMIAALKKAGGKPRFTVDPEGAHTYGYFDSVYGNDKLYAWLAEQVRWTPSPDQPIGKKLAAAKAAFDTAMAAHRPEAEAWLAKNATAKERAGYPNTGLLPRRAPAALRAAPVEAAQAVAKEYRAGAEGFNKLNKPEWGRAVLRELEEIKSAPGVAAAAELPVGRWQFKYTPGPVTGVTTFRPDWTAEHTDSTGLKQSGTVEPGKWGFVVRYKRFVEVWRQSADGRAVEIEHYQPAEDYPKFEPTAMAAGTRK